MVVRVDCGPVSGGEFVLWPGGWVLVGFIQADC
jgi:hypothetical protein